MKTLLVLAEHPGFAEAIRAGINPEAYRVIARTNLDEAEPLLEHGLAEACILDVELTGVREIWLLEKLRRKAPRCPVILYAGAKQSEWEEEAYVQGVAHVLTKPVRGKMLTALLDRLWVAPAAGRSSPPVLPSLPREIEQGGDAGRVHAAAQTLRVLRDFSGILTHSLNAEGMLRQFLLLLRELLSVNRAAIFLRQPPAAFGNAPELAENRRLRAACAMGLPSGLLQHFELSFEAGIGGHLFRLGRILRRSSEEVRVDVEAQKEFELIGAQVAVPILDRESVLGVAVFDGRVTGEPLVNSELELIFHLLEQLGLALKNIWLHDQLAGNHEMLTDILRELSSACVVVSRDLAILHANKTARKYFSRGERRGGDLEFSDLPQLLGAKVYQVLKTGAAIPSFKYEPEDSPGTVYNINIVPFQRQPAGLPASALLMAEDRTQSEQLQRLEIEAANLRLVNTVAKHLTHEIANAMMPLFAHQQLLAERLAKNELDQGFLKVMERDWADGNKRIHRLIIQTRYLITDAFNSFEMVPVAPLLEAAYQEAWKIPHGKTAKPIVTGNKGFQVRSNRAALKDAFAEVIHNAFQAAKAANPADPKIGIHLEVESSVNGLQCLQIEVEDNGSGFTPEAMQRACEPFFTTKDVGVGLGLTVARKLIEAHEGKLEIVATKSGQGGVVRISLPLDAS